MKQPLSTKMDGVRQNRLGGEGQRAAVHFSEPITDTMRANGAAATAAMATDPRAGSSHRPENSAAAHDPERRHQTTQQQNIVEEEEEGWRDPTVRAQLVLRPGQSLQKWLSAPTVVHLRNDVTTFGRLQATNDVVIANTSHHQISREGHARIYLPLPELSRPTGFEDKAKGDPEAEIEDGQSRNGVFVNYIKVQRAALRSGDAVTFGGGDGLACGAQLPVHCQQTPGLTLSYTFHTRSGTGRQLHVLYVALEGSESRPIGMVRVQRRHNIADLRQIIAHELDDPQPGQQFTFLHQSTVVAGPSPYPCSASPGVDAASAHAFTSGTVFAPISTKQERRLQATTLLPIAVLRLINREHA